MGSLIGHVAPGSGFLLIGLWHLYNHLLLLANRGPSSYRSQMWFPFYYKKPAAPGGYASVRHLELYLIITGSMLSVAMELFVGPAKHHPFDTDGTIAYNHLHNFEHSLISLTLLLYAAFALSLDKWAFQIPAHQDVLQFVAAIAFAQELLMFHLHSTDHMGVEGQYHWLLQIVIFVSLATTLLGIGPGETSFIVALVRSVSIVFQGVWLIVIGIALWTPGLIPKGCILNEEEGHMVVRCDEEKSLQRAKGLANIEFSWLLIMVTIFATSSYVVMMKVHAKSNAAAKYSVIKDVEAQKMNTNLAQTQN